MFNPLGSGYSIMTKLRKKKTMTFHVTITFFSHHPPLHLKKTPPKGKIRPLQSGNTFCRDEHPAETYRIGDEPLAEKTEIFFD